MHTPAPWSIGLFSADYHAVSTDAPNAEARAAALESIGRTKFKALIIGTSKGQVAIIPLDESNTDNARLIEAAPGLSKRRSFSSKLKPLTDGAT
jgi:hypothetical protein